MRPCRRSLRYSSSHRAGPRTIGAGPRTIGLDLQSIGADFRSIGPGLWTIGFGPRTIGAWSLEHRVWSSEHRIWSSEHRVWSSEHQVWPSEHRVWSSEPTFRANRSAPGDIWVCLRRTRLQDPAYRRSLARVLRRSPSGKTRFARLPFFILRSHLELRTSSFPLPCGRAVTPRAVRLRVRRHRRLLPQRRHP